MFLIYFSKNYEPFQYVELFCVNCFGKDFVDHTKKDLRATVNLPRKLS